MFEGFAAAGLSALANLGGGLISSGGQAAANAQNVQYQNMMNQQVLNAQMAQHAQNTAFMEDQQAFNREERQFAENFNASEAEKARLFNSKEAGVNRAFQYDLATSAYQRAMQDMRKAGLNPILAYQQGGAAVPGGSAATGGAASIAGATSGMAGQSALPHLPAPHVANDKEGLGRAIGNAVNSAVDTMKTFAGVDLMKEQEQLTKDKQTETKANIDNINQDTKRKVEETRRTAGEADNTTAAGDLMRASANSAGARAAVDSQAARVYGRYDAPQAPTFWERLGRILQDSVERGEVPPAVQRIVPATPPPSAGGSDFWGTSDRIRQRAEENRRRYGGQ